MSFDPFDGQGIEYQHLQELQAAGQRARTNAELAKLRQQLADAEVENAREAERQWRLAKCPVCGGRLEGRYRKCMHCGSELAWVDDTPCEPANLASVQRERQLARDEERQSQQNQSSHNRAVATLRGWFGEGKRDCAVMAGVLKDYGLVTVYGNPWTPGEISRELSNYRHEEKLRGLDRVVVASGISVFVILVIVGLSFIAVFLKAQDVSGLSYWVFFVLFGFGFSIFAAALGIGATKLAKLVTQPWR